MFGGIRSMLFGYFDSETSTATNAEQSTGCPIEVSSGIIEKSLLSNDTSALLEQTLNAATTKFTEQLLPQSQSIEQLQSSSHQLLPTLIEQHEEDESKKKLNQVEKDVKPENNVGDSDDDECFNADSWELLDLVDKPEATSNLNSTVQDQSVKQTNGILKQSNIGGRIKTSSNQEDDSTSQGQRQKPKVSFDTPDLVIDKEEKIEAIAPKDNDNKVKSKSGRSGNRKRNKQAKAAVSVATVATVSGSIAIQTTSSTLLTGDPGTTEKLGIEPSGSAKTIFIEQQHQSTAYSSKKAPALNYAAVLSMKSDKESSGKVELKKPFNEICAVEKSGSGEFKKPTPVGGLQSGVAIKRNRPVSSSSWSSSDEVETVDSIWNDIQNESNDIGVNRAQGQNARSKVDLVFDEDDNESIVSSGFSDCDYGYHCMNDYVMRPKKSQNKRRGGASNSSSLLSSMSKRKTDRAIEQPQQHQEGNKKKTSNVMESSIRQHQKAFSQKNIKPKKKKMVLSSSSESSEFLRPKQSSLSEVVGQLNVATPSADEKLLEFVDSTTVSAAGTESMMPPPMATISSSSTNSVNDSSDVADMDESWFVTPPPCFTGSNKLNKTKAKEAARENALIEHPSIYIASTSDQQQVVAASTVPTASTSGNKRSIAADSLSKQKAIVLKKVNKQTVPSASIVEKSTKTANSKPEVSSKRSAKKSWENKFVVNTWLLDEQDDLNDFDNLFEAENLPPKPTPKKQSRVKKQQQPKVKEVDLDLFGIADDCVLPSLVYESDFSLTSPALVGITDNTSDIGSLEKIVPIDLEPSSLDSDESLSLPPSKAVSSVDELVKPSKKVTRERKTPVQVRRIEPERQPGWQLRRKRCKRRPLSATSVMNTCPMSVSEAAKQPRIGKTGNEKQVLLSSQAIDAASLSGQSSARSTPTLIDRIGSSIVANLSNLTSGFQVSGALPMQSRASIEEVASQSSVRKSSAEFNLVARRRMSKGYMDRQNDCAKLGNSLRRADRRLKMHTKPNGSSVNRKVHANFH